MLTYAFKKKNRYKVECNLSKFKISHRISIDVIRLTKFKNGLHSDYGSKAPTSFIVNLDDIIFTVTICTRI
uniref:Uncharacterized protein n=1 Tax=Pararge aegeria TaxID=116150 RepID=S4PVH7_9NEOP